MRLFRQSPRLVVSSITWPSTLMSRKWLKKRSIASLAAPVSPAFPTDKTCPTSKRSIEKFYDVDHPCWWAFHMALWKMITIRNILFQKVGCRSLNVSDYCLQDFLHLKMVGTVVIGNIWQVFFTHFLRECWRKRQTSRAMTHDESVYPEPFVFKPERFFDENGKLNNDNRVLAYGFGRRYLSSSFTTANSFSQNTGFVLGSTLQAQPSVLLRFSICHWTDAVWVAMVNLCIDFGDFQLRKG